MKERGRERGDIVSGDRIGFTVQINRTRTREFTRHDLDSSEEEKS